MTRQELTDKFRTEALAHLAERITYITPLVNKAKDAYMGEHLSRPKFFEYTTLHFELIDTSVIYEEVKVQKTLEDMITAFDPITLHDDGQSWDFLLEFLANNNLDVPDKFNLTSLRAV